ncbi:ABC transporter, ATP-binding protein [Treponema socranskii subsp. socranskii VPI DR56BR1116 = ATCC 35536]|uniref:ABC transporter, ATP-binding protein n=1 Tax=Treponema socranskii subsp. socranskii VPI DR56BR1116 = ATCC 35536 TaxID=1125725 RepID=U2L276_TRESO|nr:ABC transporter ATP-binding protein [Treponema socranskii]ERF59493.1 ABC transporter, ATP-binding protein [Treponema socranskii subsp. socranskii VPI DR56BR1116 = ATCC 35536]ERK04842.1 ABC transporter, ATP-binding protein [Treponema socranskii subsp. socranskii VPI DR56BR1116 = ATCC 35536]
MKCNTAQRKVEKKNAFLIMARLIVLIRTLIPVMLLAIFFGSIGHLCAIAVTVSAASGIAGIAGQSAPLLPLRILPYFLIAFAVCRGIFHYAEQYCNHLIAFKLLAVIRHRIFAKLRELCPAKLEGRDKGNLISIITSDIELLEVFYAHTISPVAIALIVSACMTVFIWHGSAAAGIIALCAYITVGAVIPLANAKLGGAEGLKFRNAFGNLSAFVLDSLRGLDETIQYGCGKKRLSELEMKSQKLTATQKKLSALESYQRAITNFVILAFDAAVFYLMLRSFFAGSVSLGSVVVTTTALMSSFGPVVALSNLSNNLMQTLASGERVLSLLDEKPVVEEVTSGSMNDETAEKAFAVNGIDIANADFSYGAENILTNFSLKIPGRKIFGIHGPSGCGKSTLLKLLMRFWDLQSGSISLSKKDIRTIDTASLRRAESYVTQETSLFRDTIANNIAIGKIGASRKEIIDAAKKASLDEFVSSLPDGYDTEVGELGSTLSGGERQRIGLARAFLHDAPIMFLDEPTSNLDSLNEGIILKSLNEKSKRKTVVIVSHRMSTLNIAHTVFEMEKFL